jgi:hypothetical protein
VYRIVTSEYARLVSFIGVVLTVESRFLAKYRLYCNCNDVCTNNNNNKKNKKKKKKQQKMASSVHVIYIKDEYTCTLPK